ncbi:ABC transporter ATP-binding protein [Eudoraea adriatica]|uniref:ABC transporter ATP-binding protein n=1 Tax=Eudoraea adriatica TaxID=446681 RepID=UPI00036CCD64|nr:ATP-binding cassette domain-containing protein [Eudoraea adriatica]
MIKIDIHKKLKAYDSEMNLRIKCKIKKGELVTLYGESGAGKTSTLRILAGLLKPDKGEITINEVSWVDTANKIFIAPQKRNIGYVFQDYALFPNMSVLENLEFASNKGQNKKVIAELIEMMELGDLQNRKPQTLSGGQQQRVALARALVCKPNILLLDEPLAALDYKIRLKLQDYITRIHNEYALTTILISHDIGEIMKLSGRVLVLDQGKIVRQGIPGEIFSNEKISGKFKFIGEILKIEPQDVVLIVSVLIQNNVVKVIADKSEIQSLNVGDKVMVASKAFNPILYKIE